MLQTNNIKPIPGAVVPNAAGAVYTTPDGSTYAWLEGVTLFNDSPTDTITVDLWSVPTAGTAVALQYKLDEIPLGPKQCYEVPFKIFIYEGGALKAQASEASLVSINGGVVEYGAVA